jgi:hypothetical protein
VKANEAYRILYCRSSDRRYVLQRTVAYAAGIIAERSSHRFFVDGKEVEMTAYGINGNNYVMLRDIGKAVGFNVYWDSVNNCVQVESDKSYTGVASCWQQCSIGTQEGRLFPS